MPSLNKELLLVNEIAGIFLNLVAIDLARTNLTLIDNQPVVLWLQSSQQFDSCQRHIKILVKGLFFDGSAPCFMADEQVTGNGLSG